MHVQKNGLPSILRFPHLSIGVAWDNFDLFIESEDGRNTLHDTVGICYQDVPTEGEEITILEDNTPPNPSARQWKRRTFDFFESEIENTQISLFYKFSFVSPDDASLLIVPASIKNFKMLNISWLISYFLKIPDLT